MESYRPPRDAATAAALAYIGRLLVDYGLVECRISADGSALLYPQSTVDELRTVLEYSIALTGQLDRLQAEVDQLRAKVSALKGNEE